jgi:hypothetical protein
MVVSSLKPLDMRAGDLSSVYIYIYREGSPPAEEP